MEKLLESIKPIAKKCYMEAFIVGSEGYETEDGEIIADGRLLKICPKGVRTKVLLEIETGNRIYSHRDFNLTQKYKGRTVDLKWITSFIEHNKTLAALLIKEKAETPEPKEIPAQEVKTLSEEQVDKLKTERHIITCSCRGYNELCSNCFGTGFYTRDGMGNKI